MSDLKKQAAHWDQLAERFSQTAIPTRENNGLLDLMFQENILEDCETALDIGCGAGQYSIALGRYLKQVDGFDLSPEMIARAKAKAVQQKAQNVHFVVCPWDEQTLKQSGFSETYDLVFAHMTPAIRTEDDLTQMMAAAGKWGVLTMHTRRQDRVLDAMEQLLFGTLSTQQRDARLALFFTLLWRAGYAPRLHYEPKAWRDTYATDEALAFYKSRLATRHVLGKREEKMLYGYLKSIEKEGTITETVRSTAVTLYWKVKERE